VRLGNAEVQENLSQIGTIFSHVPKGTTTNDPLVSQFHSSISAVVFPLFNLFAKEIEAQRTGMLIKVDILAITLIALHKQLVAWFTTEGRPIFQGNLNILGYMSTKIILLPTLCQWLSPVSTHNS